MAKRNPHSPTSSVILEVGSRVSSASENIAPYQTKYNCPRLQGITVVFLPNLSIVFSILFFSK